MAPLAKKDVRQDHHGGYSIHCPDRHRRKGNKALEAGCQGSGSSRESAWNPAKDSIITVTLFRFLPPRHQDAKIRCSAWRRWALVANSTPRLHKQHGDYKPMTCNHRQFNNNYSLSRIPLSVISKNGFYFTMLGPIYIRINVLCSFWYLPRQPRPRISPCRATTPRRPWKFRFACIHWSCRDFR